MDEEDTQEAVSTQRSPAVDAGMPAIPESEDSANLDPLPDEATEPPIHQSPEQI